ncbi:ankyrin-3-like, partial [Sinocyclocheilus grahami]|uniref:ankyrin-3-like n=1 Tax=Sinocyclocheilus grahami TaxID=75366 RepID=UPI0007ACA252
MEIATTLLEYGADTNAATRQGISPLHLAAQEGNVDMVTLLIARETAINLGNKSGLTPLHLAAQEDKVNISEVLVNHGATVDPETKMAYTPLHVACHYGNIKMVHFLLKNQAKVNAKTKNGYTPLHQAAQQGHTHIINLLLQHGASPNELTVNGNTALAIARRLGYISVVDTLKVVTEETHTTVTVMEKHKMNVPETMNEVLDMSDDEGEDAMTGDTDKYLGPQDLRELGDDSLPQEGYVGFSVGARTASLRSFSSDRSNTLNRSSFTRDSMMIEEILAPTKDTHCVFITAWDNSSLRACKMQNHSLSSLIGSFSSRRFLVSFMVDARGGSMRGSRHNGMRIIIPPRKCTAPTRITCRLVKRHKLASLPPMVEGEGLASQLVEVGPAGAQFLGPVIVEIPHFGSMRGKERELIMLRSENGETWKEHHYDCKSEDLVELLNGMDEELDSTADLEKKRICRIITKDFPQYFAVVSRIKQESNQMGPDGGVLSSMTVPLVQASFPEGALTKKIRVGLQAQPVPDEPVKKIIGNRATFSPIVTVEPRRRKFHKPITMTMPVPPLSGEGVVNGYKGDPTPSLRLLCSITGGTSPAQWEDITGTTPLTFLNDCVSFTTNVSARFWLADCHQIPETVGLATQLYRELICVPYMAKFVVFAKMNDPVESSLRCFCMTDDKVDKTLEQQENFEEVARSKDIEVLEGKPIYVDCYGNLAPLTKTGQQLVFNFYAFKENRLPFCVKVRDSSQEPCGRLSFLREPKTSKGLTQTAICNLNITLPGLKKTEKPERRHTFTSLALRKRYSYLTEPGTSPQSPCERTDVRMAIVADHLGLSWTELAREMEFSVDEINQIRVENPNSLTAQSFMLLKKWVSRDGKNATTDALTAVLNKINRLDIVTLLEGPIFDYGNISGTRCFADDSAVSQEQADGYHNIELELKSPSELTYEPPTPLRQDDFFGEDSRLNFPFSAPVRPSELSLPTTSGPVSADTKPPTVIAEDTSIEGRESVSQEDWSAGDDFNVSKEIAAPSDQRDSEGTSKESDVFPESPVKEQKEVQPKLPVCVSASEAPGESGKSGFGEEDEEMTQEKIKSLLENIKLEEGSEDEEMTEERLQAILCEVQLAEKDMSSISGLQSETSGANGKTATSGHGLDTETQGQRESGQELMSSTPGVQTERQNGEYQKLQAQARLSLDASESSSKPKGKARKDSGQEVSSEAVEDRGPNHRGKEISKPEVQQEARRDNESSSDEEETVTTRVYRRRVILKGDQARNIPVETVTEEQYTDEDGNIVTRKVIRKVVRRTAGVEDKGRRKRGKRSRQANRAEQEEEGGPGPG